MQAKTCNFYFIFFFLFFQVLSTKQDLFTVLDSWSRLFSLNLQGSASKGVLFSLQLNNTIENFETLYEPQFLCKNITPNVIPVLSYSKADWYSVSYPSTSSNSSSLTNQAYLYTTYISQPYVQDRYPETWLSLHNLLPDSLLSIIFLIKSTSNNSVIYSHLLNEISTCQLSFKQFLVKFPSRTSISMDFMEQNSQSSDNLDSIINYNNTHNNLSLHNSTLQQQQTQKKEKEDSPILSFIDEEFSSLYKSTNEWMGKNKKSTKITSMDKAMEIGWRIGKLFRQKQIEEIVSDSSPILSEDRKAETNSKKELDVVIPAPSLTDSESIFMELDTHMKGGEGLGVATGFILMAIVEGLQPTAVAKLSQKLDQIAKDVLIPLLANVLGGSPPGAPGGAKGPSFLEQPSGSGSGSGAAQGPGMVAKAVAVDLIAATPAMVKQLSDIFTASLSQDLHNSLIPIVSDPLIKLISNKISDTLFTVLPITLEKVVPKAITRLLPGYVVNALSNTLTSTLTRSLTHSLTQTLRETLSLSPKQFIHCYYCKVYFRYCLECHHNDPYQTREIYGAHYGYLFSAYYSDYYGDYYTGVGAQLSELLINITNTTNTDPSKTDTKTTTDTKTGLQTDPKSNKKKK